MDKSNQNQIAKSGEFTFAEINPLDESQVLAAVSGKALKMDMSETYWTPLAIGETKRLIFQELRTETMPDFKEKDVLVDLTVAVFVEVCRDQKTGQITQQMVKTASTKIVNFVTSKNLPRHACMEVEYKGKAKSKGGNIYDNFAFYLVIQDIPEEPVATENVTAEEVK